MFKLDKIYVISLLSKRPEKIEKFKKRFPENLQKPEIFDAIDGYKENIPDWWNPHLRGSYGCYRSHIKILENIVAENLTNTIILEDDAIFCEDFIHQLNGLYDHIPEDWDQFYIGGQHLNGPININNLVNKGTNINRTHGYIIKNSQVSAKILSYITNKEFWIKNFPKHRYHIDYGYGWLHKNKLIHAYCPKKFLIGQAANEYSDTGSQICKNDRWW